MNVLIGNERRPFRTVTFIQNSNSVRLIDQRLLPHHFSQIDCTDYLATAAAIRDMAVRGAGAIGATAAFGLAQAAHAFKGDSKLDFQASMTRAFETLASARPTAVDPLNALRAVHATMKPHESIAQQQVAAIAAAHEFAETDVLHCRAIGEHGRSLIQPHMRILTHCNAGWLAFVDYGSATAPLYAAHADGIPFHVYCDETRPRCQGATLTAWELAQQGIAHDIICDNAAGHLMQQGRVDLVIVGADRVLAKTGDVTNKIGTYTKAVLAHRHKIPFYVAIPLSTIDSHLTSAAEIPIEERDPDEVLCAWGVTAEGIRQQVRIANPTSSAFNPGFDVTPAELITGIITPLGIFPPTQLPACG